MLHSTHGEKKMFEKFQFQYLIPICLNSSRVIMNYTSIEQPSVKASTANVNFLNLFIIELTRSLYRLIASNIPDRDSQSELLHGEGWWVEIFTCEPVCLYYFGHFDTSEEAHNSQNGFVEDLMAEGVNDIRTQLRFCQPKRLTVGI
jgi:hypothetical protein